MTSTTAENLKIAIIALSVNNETIAHVKAVVVAVTVIVFPQSVDVPARLPSKASGTIAITLALDLIVSRWAFVTVVVADVRCVLRTAYEMTSYIVAGTVCVDSTSSKVAGTAYEVTIATDIGIVAISIVTVEPTTTAVTAQFS